MGSLFSRQKSDFISLCKMFSVPTDELKIDVLSNTILQVSVSESIMPCTKMYTEAYFKEIGGKYNILLNFWVFDREYISRILYYISAEKFAEMSNNINREMADETKEVIIDILAPDETKACKICSVNESIIAFDCGHKISCYSCSQILLSENKHCPICRKPFKKVIRIYDS